MTSQEKIKFLERYKNIDRQIQAKCDEKSVWMSRATKITPTLSDMPKGSEQENKIETAVEKIMLIESEINAEIDELLIVKTEVKAAIQTVPSEKYRELLERRYIRGQKWEQVAVEMNYDYSWVLRMHGKALPMVQIATKSH